MKHSFEIARYESINHRMKDVKIELEDVGVVDEYAEDPLLIVAVGVTAFVQAFGNDLENNNFL